MWQQEVKIKQINLQENGQTIFFILYISMSQNTGKSRVQFRSRPVRSTSCSTKIEDKQYQKLKTTLKNKVVLNIKKKKLVLDYQSKLTYPKDIQKLDPISLNSIKSKDLESETEFECELESKATMKKQLNLKASKGDNEIKKMLIQISGNQNEMMYILKYIMKQSYHSQHQQQKSHKIISSESIKNNLSSQRQSKLKISRVVNERIEVCSNKQIMENMNVLTLSKKYSEQIQNLGNNKVEFYSDVLREDVSDKIINTNLFYEMEMDLRELISRRFQAYYVNYSYFLQILLKFASPYIKNDELLPILMHPPFLLDLEQIYLIKRTLFPKNEEFKEYKISELAERMRYFVQDRPVFDKNIVKLKALQFKSIFLTKRRELIIAFKRICGDKQSISLKSLQRILFDLRFSQNEIQIMIAKLCVVSPNINELNYLKLFQSEWPMRFLQIQQ